MPYLVLDLLKYVFLAILYIFVARAVRAVYLELRGGPRVRSAPREAPAPTSPRPPSRKTKKAAPRRAAVVEGVSYKGKTFDLGPEFVIGRTERCNLVLQDPYISSVHAPIYPKGEGFMVEDLGSTNGTYVNRRRITTPTELQRGDRIKIGKTVLEMRK